MAEWKRYHIGYWADTFEEAKRVEKILDDGVPEVDDKLSGIIGGHMADGKFTEDFDFDLSTRPVEPGPEEYTLADLDHTDDSADWITAGHVLDEQEVEWLRRLVIRKRVRNG